MECSQLAIAFTFGSESLLFGATFATVPLLIHFLYQRQAVEVRWAAMRFLLLAVQKKTRRSRLEQLLLLFLRIAIVIVVALALARPMLDSLANGGGTPIVRHHILVFDATYSMQFRDDTKDNRLLDGRNRTRFEKAKELATELVRNAHQNDLWSVVRVCEGEDIEAIASRSADAELVINAIKSLSVSDASGDISLALPVLKRLVRTTKSPAKSHVVLFSDMQSIFLRGTDGDTNSRLGSDLAEFCGKVKTTCINVANGNSPNLSITDLRCDYYRVLVGRRVQISSVVRNSGETQGRSAKIELLIDGEIIGSETMNVPPGHSMPVSWGTQFNSSGEHIVEVRIDGDHLNLDNRRRICVVAEDQFRIGIVADSLEPIPGSASYFVMQAFSPPLDSRAIKLDGRMSPVVLLPPMIGMTDLDDFDAIVISDPDLCGHSESQWLLGYLKAGGGLVVFPSGNLREFGVLAQIDDSSGRRNDARIDVQGVEFKRFETATGTHPLTQVYNGAPRSGLESVLIFKNVVFDVASDSVVALRFADRTPAVIERSVNSGLVLYFATSPSLKWSTWGAIGASFVPILHESVSRVVASAPKIQAEVGRTATMRMSRRGEEDAVELVKPDGKRAPCRFLKVAGDRYLRVEHPDLAGVYSVHSDGADLGLRICVNPSAIEGDFSIPTVGDGCVCGDSFTAESVGSGPGCLDVLENNVPAIVASSEISWSCFVVACVLMVAEGVLLRLGKSLEQGS